MLQLRRERAAKDVRDLIEGKLVSPSLPPSSVSLPDTGDVVECFAVDLANNEAEASDDIDLNDIKPYDDEELWK